MSRPIIVIEKGVPMLPRFKYPFQDMKVDDSFFVAGGALNRISVATNRAQKQLPGKKFSCRTVDGGVRVWRIA